MGTGQRGGLKRGRLRSLGVPGLAMATGCLFGHNPTATLQPEPRLDPPGAIVVRCPSVLCSANNDTAEPLGPAPSAGPYGGKGCSVRASPGATANTRFAATGGQPLSTAEVSRGSAAGGSLDEHLRAQRQQSMPRLRVPARNARASSRLADFDRSRNRLVVEQALRIPQPPWPGSAPHLKAS